VKRCATPHREKSLLISTASKVEEKVGIFNLEKERPTNKNDVNLVRETGRSARPGGVRKRIATPKVWLIDRTHYLTVKKTLRGRKKKLV